jgi:hypothetical protein
MSQYDLSAERRTRVISPMVSLARDQLGVNWRDVPHRHLCYGGRMYMGEEPLS